MRDDRDVRDIHAQAEKVPAVPLVPPVASVPLPPIIGHSWPNHGISYNEQTTAINLYKTLLTSLHQKRTV